MPKSTRTAPTPHPDILYTLAEASTFLGCQRSLLYDYMAKGPISFTLVGRERRISLKTLRDYIDARTTVTA